MAMRTCRCDPCDNEIPDGRGSKGGLEWCNRCLSRRGYWRKFGPKALVAYQGTLTFRLAVSHSVLVHVGPAIKKARAAVAAAKARATSATH
jgi:hypothetical protein